MKQREFCFTLPLGYVSADGECHREVVIRKMTGHEELLMTDPNLARNGGKLVTELLKNCLVRLGEIREITRDVVLGMASVDRDFLVVKLRSITFGNRVEAIYSCPFCGASASCVHDLEGIPVKNIGDGFSREVAVELEDGYEDKGEVYTQMTFRPPCGMDEELTADLARQNISRAKNAILTRCLKRFGSMAVERFQALGTKIFLDLTLADRRRIDEAFEGIPGLDLYEEISCAQCQRAFSVRLDLGNFLLPT